MRVTGGKMTGADEHIVRGASRSSRSFSSSALGSRLSSPTKNEEGMEKKTGRRQRSSRHVAQPSLSFTSASTSTSSPSPLSSHLLPSSHHPDSSPTRSSSLGRRSSPSSTPLVVIILPAPSLSPSPSPSLPLPPSLSLPLPTPSGRSTTFFSPAIPITLHSRPHLIER